MKLKLRIFALWLVSLCFLPSSAQIEGVSCCDWMMLKRQKLGAITLSRDIHADGLEMDMGPLGKRVLFENKFRTSPADVTKFRHTADSLGIRISSIAMSGFFAQSFLRRENYKALVEDCLNTMELFGAKTAFLPLGGSGREWQAGKGEAYETLCKRLHEVGEMAAKRGLVIGVRTAMPAKFGVRMLKKVNSKGVKIYYNVQDACDNGWDIAKELRQLGKDRIAQIHISNTDSVTLRHDPEVNLPEILNVLDKTGYRGWLTVERSRNAKDVRNVRANYGDNVAYIKEVLEKTRKEREGGRGELSRKTE